jgi:hypothetical protein
MNNQQRFVALVLALVAVIVYLFASAPSELPEGSSASASDKVIPIETVLRLVAAENDVARALYAGEIVEPGQSAGLVFNENWRDEAVEAGPLPELFLRETSASLTDSPIALGLFLGSDFSIVASNGFSARQMTGFANIKTSHEPQIFLDDNTQLYTAMFPELASVQSCVDCHNGHPDSPKTDWAVGDVMGATTWTYPKGAVTANEALLILSALRSGFGAAYEAYITRAQGFSNPPEVGDQWPRDGYFLPSPEVFLAEFSSRASPLTIETIIAAVEE